VQKDIDPKKTEEAERAFADDYAELRAATRELSFSD
jgi:hypothetical protein